MELNKKKNCKKGPKAKPAPVYDNFQKEIANDLLEQAKHFLLNIDEAKTIDDRRDLENQLFQLGAYPLMAGAEYPDLALYAVERFIRTDRESHELVRATTSIVVMNTEKNIPQYFINAYLSLKGGRISVTPMGDKGPIGRNTYAINVDVNHLVDDAMVPDTPAPIEEDVKPTDDCTNM